jgi:prolyl 4-hydroxylase
MNIRNPIFRFTRSGHIPNTQSVLVAALDSKICNTLGTLGIYSTEHSEGVMAQRYSVGGYVMPHHDYFGGEANEQLASSPLLRNQRTWSFMVYLNEDMQGGETRFIEIDYLVKPKKGMALLWNNLHKDGSPNKATLHCSDLVKSGYKFIVNKWFRRARVMDGTSAWPLPNLTNNSQKG